ncbi:MAG TPA: CDP-glycerol glycerophosphotransferase family protein [Methylococcaceae bacterium]|nr:CDP-glycerol glycerophosphotransferase family protein [Methylococcaceae bacterium]
MIAYFTKMYQAVPALMQIYQARGGVFVSTRRSTIKAIKKSYPGTRAELMGRVTGEFSKAATYLKQADVIVTGSPYKKILEGYPARKYTVFHGTYTYLSSRELASMQHFDMLCAIGPRMVSMMENSGLPIKFMVSGYLPFLEYPTRTPSARLDLLTAMGLDPDKKTVLYVPTGKPNGSWDWLAEKLVAEISPDCNLILRPHPSQSVTARIRDTFGFYKLRRLCKKRGATVLDLTSLKLSSLYSISDLVISDGTSTAEESLYYDLPQVFVETDRFSKRHVKNMMLEKGADKEYVERLVSLYDCGTSLTPDTANLQQFLGDSIENAGKYAPYRSEYFSWVFGDRGLDNQHRFMDHLGSITRPPPASIELHKPSR